MLDDRSPFIPGPRVHRAATGTGPLDGLRFAAKDLFDVAGEVTSYGHPDWARTHAPASGTAVVITDLLEAGATLIGKTKTVELAYGLTGENVWHGTPLNPAAPDRFPGGSSCGSAAATAGGDVDFALGSDTGGSVRIPGSYCGLFGLRPSTGTISLAGACALAPSFDTPGWFARDAITLGRVGRVLLPAGGGGSAGPFILVQEVWDNADPAVTAALAPLVARLRDTMRVALLPDGLAANQSHFAALQATEAWTTHGAWITAVTPDFGPGVGERFAIGATMDPALRRAARTFQRDLQARLRPLLAGGAVLVYPTSPCPAPLLTSPATVQTEVRMRTIGVTAIAGLCGLPELTMPGATVDGAPVGLSFVAGPGRDRALLELAESLAAQ